MFECLKYSLALYIPLLALSYSLYAFDEGSDRELNSYLIEQFDQSPIQSSSSSSSMAQPEQLYITQALSDKEKKKKARAAAQVIYRAERTAELDALDKEDIVAKTGIDLETVEKAFKYYRRILKPPLPTTKERIKELARLYETYSAQEQVRHLASRKVRKKDALAEPEHRALTQEKLNEAIESTNTSPESGQQALEESSSSSSDMAEPKGRHALQILAWREKNKERISHLNATWREKNKERIKDQRAAYRAKNKEEVKAQNLAYREKNKEEIRAQQVVYRERNKKAFDALIEKEAKTQQELNGAIDFTNMPQGLIAMGPGITDYQNKPDRAFRDFRDDAYLVEPQKTSAIEGVEEYLSPTWLMPTLASEVYPAQPTLFWNSTGAMDEE